MGEAYGGNLAADVKDSRNEARSGGQAVYLVTEQRVGDPIQKLGLLKT